MEKIAEAGLGRDKLSIREDKHRMDKLSVWKRKMAKEQRKQAIKQRSLAEMLTKYYTPQVD